jgi:cytochrome b subunit of formate dehydrogenase
VLMLGVFVTHLVDLDRRRRQEFGSWRALLLGPHSMLFSRRDLRDFWGTVRWFVGAGPRPRYGRWTYWEKFDYFAVFWGIFVIGSTGLTLWFPIFFTRFLPGWSINVATIIHSDEALLATGFIFTVHFFNTHLRPEKFPMDTVIFTGSVEEDEFRKERPEEYERLVREGRLDSLIVPPPKPRVVRRGRIVGTIAIVFGLTLFGLIIHAVVHHP